MEWRGRNTVLLQCDTMRRFTVDDHLLAVLSRLDEWTAADEIEVAGRTLGSAEWEQLLEMGVVEPESGNGGARRDGASLWTPFELAVQRQSRRGGSRDAETLALGPPPPAFKTPGGTRVTSLPAPDPVLPVPLGTSLAQRRSVRTYADRPLRMDELSTLLHHAARVREVFDDSPYGECALHPYPSGGARSELELYVIASDVDGLDAGAHWYDARAHELVQVGDRDEHQQRLLQWVHVTTGSALNRDPQAMLLITAVFPRVMWKYQRIGLSLVYKDTGCLFQTLYLVATALGLAPCAIGGGDETANSRWLGLDPLEESQVGLFLVGPHAHAAHKPAAGHPASPERDRILRMSQGFLGSAVVRAALRLGVFDILARGDAPSVAIAAAAGTDARGMRTLLDALTAFGLVHASERMYGLSSIADRYLVSERSDYIGDMVGAYTDDVLWDSLRNLTEAVQRGGSALPEHVAQPRHPYWPQLATALGAAGDPAIEAVADALAPELNGRTPLRVLDIGCGNGAMAYAIASRNSAAEICCVDWPDVVSVARNCAQRLGLAGRAHFIEGDMLEVPLDGPYDVILVSHVLHNLDGDACAKLLLRARDALADDGVLAIHDMVRDGSPRDDPAPYLFSVITLSWTPGGDVRSLREHEALLGSAGLRLRRVARLAESGTRLLLAEHARAGADPSG